MRLQQEVVVELLESTTGDELRMTGLDFVSILGRLGLRIGRLGLGRESGVALRCVVREGIQGLDLS